MNLLLERTQSSGSFTLVPLQIGGGVVFSLWMKTELDEEEQELIKKYRLESVLMIAHEKGPAFYRALRASIVFGVVVGMVCWFVFSQTVAIVIGGVVTALMTLAYYNELREHIYVRDLIHGRTFRCFSLVELLQKEAYLTNLSMYLRQVLESAKHWDGREIRELPPLDPEAARQLVLRGP